ncbi:UDP-glucose/GDP-mannose dehydrogenase family protein [Candidatus Peregrinibacteria bacterium]|nr:UDP-glucose/GDP-mannose dehydrogenase family protein [Candidatus Peregrinibacteria bacterium]
MKITIVGTGYVGLITAVCFSEIGHDVMGIDIDEKKIKKLQKGIAPIYELGLDELLSRNLKEGRLKFDTDIKKGIEFGEVVFSAVGTPPDMNHWADLQYVEAVAKNFGKYANDYKLFVNKSTVPVGTGDWCYQIIKEALQQRGVDFGFDVVGNPEFLREGAAVKDTMDPDRIIIGTHSKKAREIMQKIYSPIAKSTVPVLYTTLENAELIKYAANSFLATKISFINQMANFCERVGGDITVVAKGIGMDKRIGGRFLHAGIGYGGSCFPKDIKTLIQHGKAFGYDFSILEAVEQVNSGQKEVAFEKLMHLCPDLSDKTIAVWGLSFKPKTDDMREAPSVKLIKKLIGEGAKVNCYDPVAMENAKALLKSGSINFAKDAYEALKNADALLILTEWDTFRAADPTRIKELMKGDIMIDGRNIFEAEEIEKSGLKYFSVGRPDNINQKRKLNIQWLKNRGHGGIKDKTSDDAEVRSEILMAEKISENS